MGRLSCIKYTGKRTALRKPYEKQVSRSLNEQNTFYRHTICLYDTGKHHRWRDKKRLFLEFEQYSLFTALSYIIKLLITNWSNQNRKQEHKIAYMIGVSLNFEHRQWNHQLLSIIKNTNRYCMTQTKLSLSHFSWQF